MQNSSERPRVLLVEDEPMLRLVAADCFEHAGFIVVEAGHAQQAMDFFNSGGPKIDLVFTDVRMPGAMDGLALASWVIKHHPETPVFVTSGHLGDDRTHADLMDVHRYFPKPYCLEQVVECIHATLAKKAA
jgi:DNA-binding NtrC family response regulator